MVLALLVVLAALMLMAFAMCTAMCVAAARADRLMRRDPPGATPVRPDVAGPVAPGPVLSR